MIALPKCDTGNTNILMSCALRLFMAALLCATFESRSMGMEEIKGDNNSPSLKRIWDAELYTPEPQRAFKKKNTQQSKKTRRHRSKPYQPLERNQPGERIYPFPALSEEVHYLIINLLKGADAKAMLEVSRESYHMIEDRCRLKAADDVTNANVSEIMKRKPHLKELDLSLCKYITDELVVDIPRLYPNLSWLGLNKEFYFTSLDALSKFDDNWETNPKLTVLWSMVPTLLYFLYNGEDFSEDEDILMLNLY